MCRILQFAKPFINFISCEFKNPVGWVKKLRHGKIK